MSRSSVTPPGPGVPGAPWAAERHVCAPPAAAVQRQGAGLPRPAYPAARRDFGFAPWNWRVAARLHAVQLSLVVVALVFGGLRVHDAYGTWQRAEAAERTAELLRAAAGYAHALADERDVTATRLLTADARRATDRAREEFWARVDAAPRTSRLQRRIDTVRLTEPQLTSLRRTAYVAGQPAVATGERYLSLQQPLMTLVSDLASAGSTGRAVSLAASASSLQRALGSRLLLAPGPGERARARQLGALASYDFVERMAEREYRRSGSKESVAWLDKALAAAADRAARHAPEAPDLATMADLIGSGRPPEVLAERGVTAQAWFRAATAEVGAYRQTQQRLMGDAVATARGRAATALQDLAGNAVAVAAVLLLAFLAAAATARSVSRNLSELRSAAFEVAGQRLPAVVDQLSRTHPAHVDTEVAPSPVTSRDEIGEIARAFDQVHREAVRLATEQALLRGNVSAVTHLSCQNQRLVERQLALLDDLAGRAADPRQREHLSRLDHLATRMRRNGESMLVLAGAEPGGQRPGPAPLPEVVRAAVREGAADRRIVLAGVPECEIHGAVVTDLVHMLADLLETAVAFTTPDTAMGVAGSQLADGRIRVEVHADGLDLTAAEIAVFNARLSRRPDVGAARSPCCGLYVVGGLAERHGIVVRLRPSGGPSGTTALVTLPAAATRAGAAGPGRAVGSGEPAVTGARAATERGCLPAAASGRDPAWRCPPPTFGTLPSYPDPSHTESSHNSPANRWQRVGFRGLDPGVPERRVTTYHATARAGLPRRERRWQQPETQQRDAPAPRPEEPLAQRAPGEVRGECGPCPEGAAGGLTAAGLPRRVPRAHLVGPVARAPAPEDGQVSRDQVSRALEDVHSGSAASTAEIRQGRGADTGRGTQHDHPGFCPGTTYDQEP